MEAVKVMFYAFRDRAATMGQGFHHMGLISFDNRVEKMLDLTSQLDRFEAIVDDLEKRGQTAIYSAVIEAAVTATPVAATIDSTKVVCGVITLEPSGAFRVIPAPYAVPVSASTVAAFVVATSV